MAYGKKYDYNPEDIVAMHYAGMACADIASKYGMSKENVSYILRKRGISSRRKGGMVAMCIPKHEFQAKSETQHNEELEAIAVKNAANACLLVESRETVLKGTVGHYTLYGNAQMVMNIAGDCVNVEIKQIGDLIAELKAIARNVGSIGEGPEMW